MYIYVYILNSFAGSGLTLQRNGRWMLRGIVSAGVNDPNNNGCKLHDYVIFTDVAKFTEWIREFM